MSEATISTYDLVEYPEYWYDQSHPDRLAVMGKLFGVETASPERCRVLEIGCGVGWNVLCMASLLPESEFVGIDRAERPIARGRELVTRLGLENVSLHTLDLTEVSEEFGSFDYIIAHGLYSWVAPSVRDNMLALCNTHLSPQGIAYVSYNTYPGKYLSQMVREMMLYYCQRFEDPQEKTGQARAFLRFIKEAQNPDGFYGQLLGREFDRIDKLSDEYFYHDDLSEINTPSYFHEFVEHAESHGLQYLAEANFHEMNDQHFPEEVAQTCRGLARNHNEWEQYLDFIVLRQFRHSLLCHQDVEITRAPELERIRAFYIGAPIAVEAWEPSANGKAPKTVSSFPNAGAETMNTTDPVLQAALVQLRDRWPEFVSFDDLVDAARAGAARRQPDRQLSREEDAHGLGMAMLRLYGMRFVSLRVRRPPVFTEVSPRPMARPLTRLQANATTSVCNAVAEPVVPEPLERHLLPLLDGTRDRAALIEDLAERAEADGLQLEPDGESVTNRQRIEEVLDENIDAALQRLARQAMLVE